MRKGCTAYTRRARVQWAYATPNVHLLAILNHATRHLGAKDMRNVYEVTAAISVSKTP